MKCLLMLSGFFICHSCFAQSKSFIHSWQASVSNYHAAMPFGSFSRLFYRDINPGLSFGADKTIFHSDKAVLGLQLHYFHVQKIQHSVAATIGIGYHISLPAGFSFVPNVGGGVMQAFAAGKIFELNERGAYEKKANWGRTQMLLLLNERLEKRVTKKGHCVFLAYQQTLQAPFIKEYVPLLPFNSLTIGISIPNR